MSSPIQPQQPQPEGVAEWESAISKELRNITPEISKDEIAKAKAYKSIIDNANDIIIAYNKPQDNEIRSSIIKKVVTDITSSPKYANLKKQVVDAANGLLTYLNLQFENPVVCLSREDAEKQLRAVKPNLFGYSIVPPITTYIWKSSQEGMFSSWVCRGNQSTGNIKRHPMKDLPPGINLTPPTVTQPPPTFTQPTVTQPPPTFTQPTVTRPQQEDSYKEVLEDLGIPSYCICRSWHEANLSSNYAAGPGRPGQSKIERKLTYIWPIWPAHGPITTYQVWDSSKDPTTNITTYTLDDLLEGAVDWGAGGG